MRLLIADDVGIGKTIEAGLILREIIDRGETDRFSVLCPPHLVEQWTGELKTKFDIDAIAVTASSASRLERDLPASQSLFEAYPFTVVSLDYIKAERRRESLPAADYIASVLPKSLIVRDWRGKARAAAGMTNGAIDDFNFFVANANGSDRAGVRSEWLRKLKEGQAISAKELAADSP